MAFESGPDIPILEWTTGSASSTDPPVKKTKQTWPPVNIGQFFRVRREDQSKWPLTEFRSSALTLTFVVTGKGCRCNEKGCPNPGFGEAEKGSANHSNSLSACHMHIGTHSPPKKGMATLSSFFAKAPSAESLQSKRDRDMTMTATATATVLNDSIGNIESSASSSSQASSSASLVLADAASGISLIVYIIFPSWLMNAQTASASVALPVMCHGFPWPGSGLFVDNYPFALHGLFPLAWHASTTGILHSRECIPFLSSAESQSCDSCSSLATNPLLLSVISRADDEGLYKTPICSAYLTAFQLRQRSDAHKKRSDMLRLMMFHRDKRLTRLMSKFDDNKAIIVLLSQNKIPRVHQVLSQLLKRGLSGSKMVAMIQEATLGNWCPTGNKDEDDLDLALLTKHFSPRLLIAMQRNGGMASLSSISRRTEIPRFITSPHERIVDTVLHNFHTFIFSKEVKEPCLWAFALDGTVLEEGLRASMNDGHIRGTCQCTGKYGLSTLASSPSDVDLLVETIHEGHIHLACEVLVGAMIPIRYFDYSPKVVYAEGVCKHVDAAHNALILRTVINIWKTHESGEALRGPLCTTQSDGAAVLVRAQHDLFDHDFSEDSGPVADAFRASLLFPKYCGRADLHGVVDGRDLDHNMKRVRTRANTKKKGFRVASMMQYVRSFLRQVLKESGLLDETQLSECFNEGGADAQNVPASVTLLKALAELKTKKASDFPAREPGPTRTALQEIRILSEICSCIVKVKLGKELSVEEHLDNLSTLSHLLFVVYRRHRTAFIPAQLYNNLQRMVRAHFWSVQTGKLKGISEYYIFLDSTSGLEQNFGIVRSLHGSGTQFDLVQFEDRETAAMSVHDIYSRHPDWHRGPRRLVGSMDHMNPRSWLM